MKNTAAAKTTTSDRLTTVLSYGALLLLGYFVFLILEPFLVPLVWSAVLAIFFFPLHARLAKRWKPYPASLVGSLGVECFMVGRGQEVSGYTDNQAVVATASGQ